MYHRLCNKGCNIADRMLLWMRKFCPDYKSHFPSPGEAENRNSRTLWAWKREFRSGTAILRFAQNRFLAVALTGGDASATLKGRVHG